MKKPVSSILFAGLAFWLLATAAPVPAAAHCDSLDGPVILTAKAALEKGDVTPVLKWVRPQDEKEITEAFRNTLVVRGKGPEARELADRYFFETLVRVHRAGEGAPYTGLKKTVAESGPLVMEADRALRSGSVKDLVKLVGGAVTEGIEKRFARTAELQKHADESVEKGREFVEAYVDYVHYVEGVHAAAAKAGGHGEESHGGVEEDPVPGTHAMPMHPH